ncbi:thiol:disulfide interchange protein DsbA/DsbL [Vogesella fluminis]|uniref:Thiol:disulfide interchange protein n=1 Tax=Vogesella fluminis TaxID=1069161 RepID=A0ABQ3HC03_9NEIS|nr:thiol:disulfide interchange protein DsbA/DsbL [Vogesella fluminis]GHD78001.1 thiol:disulfide interchange protein DsbA [Vogesella fluminis]
MKKWVLAALLLSSSLAHAALVEGRDYTVLTKPQATVAAGKVEVIEFFSYNCVHCYNLDPALEAWRKKLPANVQFRREQIVWNKPTEGLARLYATFNATKTLGKLHQPAFDAVMKKNIDLADEAKLRQWLPGQGVNTASFMQTYKSFGVNAQVARASKMTRDYAVQGTPAIVVGGKYMAQPVEPARLLQVVNELVAKVASGK